MLNPALLITILILLLCAPAFLPFVKVQTEISGFCENLGGLVQQRSTLSSSPFVFLNAEIDLIKKKNHMNNLRKNILKHNLGYFAIFNSNPLCCFQAGDCHYDCTFPFHWSLSLERLSLPHPSFALQAFLSFLPCQRHYQGSSPLTKWADKHPSSGASTSAVWQISSQMVLNCDLFFCSKTKYINLSFHWCQAWEPEFLPNPRSHSQQHNGQLTMPAGQPERMSLFSLLQQIPYCLAHRLLDLVNCPKLHCFSVKLSPLFPLILFINKINFYFHFLVI